MFLSIPMCAVIALTFFHSKARNESLNLFNMPFSGSFVFFFFFSINAEPIVLYSCNPIAVHLLPDGKIVHFRLLQQGIVTER